MNIKQEQKESDATSTCGSVVKDQGAGAKPPAPEAARDEKDDGNPLSKDATEPTHTKDTGSGHGSLGPTGSQAGSKALADMVTADQIASNNLAMMNMIANQQGNNMGMNNMMFGNFGANGMMGHPHQQQHSALNQSMNQLMMNGAMNNMGGAMTMNPAMGMGRSMMGMGGTMGMGGNDGSQVNSFGVGENSGVPLVIPPKRAKNVRLKQTFSQKLMNVLSTRGKN